ncbi:glycoside hydrolase, partial [Epithele typhae]|uniref:glycoside hydrolase n=1 Tax=Epithele typhae TaxID=378194 RepID=UPI0020083FCE
QWGSDVLFINGGYLNVTIPSCVKSGQYLFRAEAISLSSATQYPGAQFFTSCAQIEVTGGGDAEPDTVSFPGAYTPTDPGIVTNIYTVQEYTVPGQS